MKIEVLYFEGCPNHRLAVERVKEVLKQEGLRADISEANVPDAARAQAVGFLGSPTIRVDGLDVEPSARSSREFGMMCRTYSNAESREGVPPTELIRAALRETARKDPDPRDGGKISPARASSSSLNMSKRNLLLMGSSMISAVAASFCCILPVIAAVLGATGFAASEFFAGWRPYLLVVTFGLLGVGFYMAYRPVHGACKSSGVCERAPLGGGNRAMLWVIADLVVVLAAFPYYSGWVARAVTTKQLPAAVVAQNAGAHVVLKIEGMDCPVCAALIEQKLSRISGVRRAEVSFEKKQASVEYDPRETARSRFAEAISDAGYKVVELPKAPN